MGDFYRRLSRGELELLVELFRLSNGSLPVVRDEIIQYYLPLVPQLTMRYSVPGAERDDLIQEGGIGVIEAVDQIPRIEDFNIRYVVTSVNNKLNHMFRRETRRWGFLSSPPQDDQCLGGV